MLKQIGVRFELLPVDIDESMEAGENAERFVVRLANAKSLRGQFLAQRNTPVLSADTIVVVDKRILGKPVDRDHGVAMLTQLAGREHRVLSAVSLRAERNWQALSSSTVFFRKITKREMLTYWDSGEPLDKAGGYAIQGLGAAFVTRMEGSFSGVMGLPLFETSELLKKIGINVLQETNNKK